VTFCELPLWEICIPRIVHAEEILIGCFVECQSIKKVGGRHSVEELYQALFFVSPLPPECLPSETKIEPDRRLPMGRLSFPGYGSKLVIDHFHYDVAHTEVSGSCSKDRAQGCSIAGKFKIIHKNTCNAMAAELVDHITSIMCIIERTSSAISNKPAFTPPGDIKRQQRKSKEDLFCKILDFFYRFALGALQNFLVDGFLYARFSGR